MALNLRQERFVSAYLLEPNATKAAIAAGYSERSAEVNAHKLMKNLDVAAAIAERAKRSVDIADTSVARIVTELAAIGFSDVTAIFTDDGQRLKPIADWPKEIRICIASIETTRRVVTNGIRKVKDPDEGDDCLVHEEEADVITKIRFWSKVEALKLLAVYRKMVGGGDTVPADQRQTFVGLAITVAPGATANLQINTGGKSDA